MDILLLILAFGFLFARSGMVGLAVTGVVWIAAAAFNPNIDSGLVWLIAFAVGYLTTDEV